MKHNNKKYKELYNKSKYYCLLGFGTKDHKLSKKYFSMADRCIRKLGILGKLLK